MTTLSILSKQFEILSFSLRSKPVMSNCGLIFQPKLQLKKLNPDDCVLLIIPGGKEAKEQKDLRLLRFIHTLNQKKINIASIGNGPLILGRAGVLEGSVYTGTYLIEDERRLQQQGGTYTSKPMVEHNNLITAQTQSYKTFGLTLGKRFNCFDTIEDYTFYKGNIY